jgi:aspartate aminotransferase
MLEALTAPAPDKIIELMGLYAADPRTDKVDLGVGVYKDAHGNTPIMRAVKAAEQKLWQAQTTKTYVGLLGDLGFVDAMRALIFADAVPADRIAGAQTPGGTGAVRQLLELVRIANPEAVVWYSDPTWPNHPAILNYLGIPSRTYRYFDAASRGVDFEGMLADLAGMKPGDVLLLHGCCHNPTGANLSLEQWRTLTELAVGRGRRADDRPRLPGLRRRARRRRGRPALHGGAGAGAAARRLLLQELRPLPRPVGAAFAVAQAPNLTAIARGNLAMLNRLNYSFPPDHGAKLVEIILGDPALRAEWMAELEGMRQNMLTLRRGLRDALRRATNSDRFDFVAEHRGMFSRLGASPEQVARLREHDGIYMVGDSRVNIAGLPADGLDRLAKAIAAAGV